jgi:hypothetical protein
VRHGVGDEGERRVLTATGRSSLGLSRDVELILSRQLVKLGVDVDSWVAVVVVAHDQDSGACGRFKRHDGTQAPGKVFDAQALKDVSGEAVAQRGATVAFQVAEPRIEPLARGVA